MSKKIDRRSFLRRVGVTAGAGALGVIAGTTGARAQSGCTDSDTGNYADAVGNGSSCGTTGYTDSDSGAMADPGGNGRGGRRGYRTGLTDADSGSTADQANFGRGSDH